MADGKRAAGEGRTGAIALGVVVGTLAFAGFMIHFVLPPAAPRSATPATPATPTRATVSANASLSAIAANDEAQRGDSTANRAATAQQLAAPRLASAPFGLAQRAAWTTSKVRGTPEPPPPFRTNRLYPRLRFRNPVVLAKPPGLARFFVGEQSGKIYSFPVGGDPEQADLALDISVELLGAPNGTAPRSPVDNTGLQGLEALYGLTFHPRFEQNRYCYVCYVVRGEPGKQLPEGTRVSRFRVTETSPPKLDVTSEQVVITWLQGGHNGGCLAFGPDGCLYISTGDGGFANPPDGLNAGQDVTNLLSSILRIDVDHPDEGRAYSIPADNPLVKVAGARGEIWCYGLRNPWKMSFDRQTGELWVGDVGWELWELVYRVERGGNYGWSVVEGRQAVHPERKVGPTPILPPTIEIPHTDGVSITGGHVYRGQRFPELQGQYIFGDWETRRVWSASWDAATKTAGERRDLVDPTVRLVAFAEDDAGELLLVDYDDGTIHGLERNESRSDLAPFPTRLSETGLFASVAEQQPADGVYAFDVNVEQWSDFATAQRWIATPDRGVVRFLPQKANLAGSMFSSSLIFPLHTVLVKTLSLEQVRGSPQSARRVETQLLHFDGKFWRGYSYAWNDEQTDAELVGALGGERTIAVTVADPRTGKSRVEPQTWRYSSRVECARCHNQWAEYALAFHPRQLHRVRKFDEGEDEQLRTFEAIGLIDLGAGAAPPLQNSADQSDKPSAPEWKSPEWYRARYPRFVDPRDESQPLDARARSYLHVNCAHCHRTGGGGTAYIELQQELPLDALKVVDVRPTQGTFDLPDARIIAAGDPYRSTLFYRVSKTGSGRMPHVGSELVDERGARLLHDWIRSLPPYLRDEALLKRLADLDAPGASERESKERDKTRRELLEQVFESPARALQVARRLGDSGFSPSLEQQLLEAAWTHPSPAVRDLFERFAPPEKRPKRLGSQVRPAEILALEGSLERGAVLFANTTGVQCKNCHRIGQIGGRLGPDLSLIGKKYSRAQILEHILEPSKVVDPKYVSYVVEVSDGRVVQGLLVDRTPEEFVLRDAADRETRILAEDVEALTPQRKSLMPDLQLRDFTPQQVADLLAYLAEQK